MNYLMPLFLFAILLFVSCSGDDDASGPNAEDHNYFPLTANSSWTYNNVGEQGPARDSIYVNGTENVNGHSYTNLDAQVPLSAFMTVGLTNNLVRTTTSQLLIQGELAGAPVEGFPEISIPLNDVVLYDSDAQTDDELGLVADEITQTFQDIPLVINYRVLSAQGAFFETYTVGTQVFDNVLSATLTVNLSVTAEIDLGGVTVPVPILAEQDVVAVTNYYAADVGLVYSETLVEYQLEDLSGTGIELPFPNESSATSTQSIDTYSIGN